MPGIEFMRGIEDQKRGALHDHILIWSPIPLHIKGLKKIARLAGFGHSVDAPAIKGNSRQAAEYVSKYITKSTDARSSVPWWGQIIDRVDKVSGEISFTEGLVHPTYRTWSCSRAWGQTMAQVKAQCGAYAAVIQQKRAAEGIGRLVAAFGAEFMPSVAALPDG